LTITLIETVPIRVPLERTYAGSHDRMTHRPQLSDGWLDVPTGRGLGWELDLDYVERHRIST
jgi:L-alanine-DL-glutamate epimerase-like enolase superfamily enzyme